MPGAPRDRDRARVAVVGCGAVAELLHFPALKRNESVDLVALVDLAEDRAKRLAAELGVERTSTDHRELLDLEVDGAIVTAPTNAHAGIAGDLLRAGVHVLVEKPMARSPEECDAMIAAADEEGATLAVSLPRRFYHQCRFAKRAIQSGLLGTVRSFDVRDGYAFSWPVKTDFPFRKEAAGGGVLIDLGIHTLDLLVWWFGDVRVVDYRDNDLGGVESEALARFATPEGAEGVGEFSWTRRLRNTIVVEGDRGVMEVDLTSNHVRLRLAEAPEEFLGPVGRAGLVTEPKQLAGDLTAAAQEDWIDAFRNGRPPAVSGEEGRRSLSVVQACYEARRPLELPWMESPASAGVGP